MTNIPEIDWRLHAPMVYKILTDSKYLEKQGVSFYLNDKTFTIHRIGGWSYSPCRIRSFEAALSVLRDNGAGCSPHFSAICLLEGVSYHKILDSEKDEIINRIVNPNPFNKREFGINLLPGTYFKDEKSKIGFCKVFISVNDAVSIVVPYNTPDYFRVGKCTVVEVYDE